MMNKILVVEDDKDINNLLKIILESNGYEVCQAYSGKMGIEMLNDDFDLVLLDLMMPLVSGEEMVVKMRAKNFNMPVIIITAKIDEKTKFYTFDIGADDFITKPFEKADLLNRVKANIRRYRHLNSNMSKNSILEFKNLKLYEDENRILIKGEELKVTDRKSVV